MDIEKGGQYSARPDYDGTVVMADQALGMTMGMHAET